LKAEFENPGNHLYALRGKGGSSNDMSVWTTGPPRGIRSLNPKMTFERV